MNDGPHRVLVSRATRESHRELLDAAAAGHAVQWLLLDEQDAGAPQPVHAAFISRDITGLSTKHQPLEALSACYAVLRASPDLAWVQAHSAGADRPIYPELRARGVAVTTASGANAGVVAATALAGLLALSRRFPQLIAAQHERRWAPLVGAGPLPPDLFGQTLVLVGWGPIAQALQPHLALLGMKVIVVRRSAAPAAPGVETVSHDQLHTVLPRADWLLLACPLTAETRGLVDAAALALLPAGAHLINVARGEVVVEAALTAALQSGHLAGAYLDVFEHEPLDAASPLWGHPGVIVTPHSAGQSAGHAARVAAIFADNLGRWLRCEALAHAVA
ncbi:MAG: D-2-hydroxyacid dehydrogenase [Betaproteobacteria bacterium]|nr:D-2-hydroxyacid dehydrogenase [Betaproteobacteria bacterium]